MIRFLTTLILASMPLVQTTTEGDLFKSDIADFAFELFGTTPFENTIISPLGVHTLFSTIYPGAKNGTADELAKVLRLPDLQTTLVFYRLFEDELRGSLGGSNIIDFRLANKAFIKKQLHLWIGYKLKIKNFFNATIESLDFEENEVAANTINHWAAKKTNNKIRNLVSSGDLNERTQMVLINAIYVKASWLRPFHFYDTKDDLFYHDGNKAVTVPMMQNLHYFDYAFIEYLDAQILEMPTVNQNVTMIVILPKRRDGVFNLTAQFKDISLSGMLALLRYTAVDVTLPRFKIEHTTDLISSMKDLHLTQIFDPNQANLKGIARLGSEKLFVSNAIQKAIIEVSENGIEAAAGSVGSIKLVSAKPDPREAIVFRAEHPFVFIIKTLVSNEPVPLFMGSVYNPVQE